MTLSSPPVWTPAKARDERRPTPPLVFVSMSEPCQPDRPAGMAEERGASPPLSTLPMKGQGKAPPPQTPPPMGKGDGSLLPFPKPLSLSRARPSAVVRQLNFEHAFLDIEIDPTDAKVQVHRLAAPAIDVRGGFPITR